MITDDRSSHPVVTVDVHAMELEDRGMLLRLNKSLHEQGVYRTQQAVHEYLGEPAGSVGWCRLELVDEGTIRLSSCTPPDRCDECNQSNRVNQFGPTFEAHARIPDEILASKFTTVTQQEPQR